VSRSGVTASFPEAGSIAMRYASRLAFQGDDAIFYGRHNASFAHAFLPARRLL
jgi:hypothetical protein